MRQRLLRAEAIAWPLADPAALASGCDEVRHETLWPGFQRRATALQGADLPDYIARDCWQERTVAEHLRAHGRRILDVQNRRPRLRVDRERPGEEILQWRALSLRLPPAHLVAAATPMALCPDWRVQVLDRSLAPTQPLALLHAHAGAVPPFEVLWTRLATRLDLDKLAEKDGASSPAGLGPARWQTLLVHALVARRWLAQELLDVPWARLGREPESRLVQAALDDFLAGCLRPPRVPRRDPRLRRLLRIAIEPWRRVRRLRSASEPWRRGPRKILELQDVWDTDPIAAPWLPQQWPEGTLLQAGLWSEDRRVRRVVTQVLRCRTLLYRHLVQDPCTPSLTRFVEYYQRIGAYRQDLDLVSLDLCTDERPLTLGSVELRTQPEDSVRKQEQLVERTAGWRAKSRMEAGWTMHFVRTPRKEGVRYYADTYRDFARRADALARGLRRRPGWLHTLRGLDLAGLESEGPMWLALPFLLDLRDLSGFLAARNPELRALRTSIHAGEDFVHPLSGLRAVHEPLLWDLTWPGDRLGHAVVLGVNLAGTYRGVRVVQIPRLTRLMDLLWLRLQSAELQVPLDGALTWRVEDEIARLAKELFGQEVVLDPLLKMRRCLGDRRTLARLGLRFHSRSVEPEPWKEDDLLLRILYDEQVHRRGRLPVDARVEEELAVAVDLQTALRRLVARTRVAVELNPSSNYVIGALESPLDQPAFQLRPLEPDDQDIVEVALNTDDPLTFATTLADEHAYVWAGVVVDGGRAPRYATEWLREAASTSWRFRFTTPSVASGDFRPPAAG